MKIVNQPHDKFFRATFGKTEVATNFLETYLPEDLLKVIDMNTLEAQKESFLDEELKERFADLLFMVNINDQDGYIYMLFEHKSYKDRKVIFQVMRYMIDIWESKIGNSLDEELPIILPLVVYHDKGKWTIKKTLGDMITNYDKLPENLKKYIPNFEYLVFDLSEYDKEETKLMTETMIVVKALSSARHATREEAMEIIIEAIKFIKQSNKKDEITYYVSACIRYILGVRDDITPEDMEREISKISIEGGELIMSVAEKMRQEEVRRERRRMAKNLLMMNDPVAKIAMVTGLKEKEIEELKKEMKKNE